MLTFCLIALAFITVELMSEVATQGGMKWISSLLESEHVLMVNDGLLALSLLAAIKNGMWSNT